MIADDPDDLLLPMPTNSIENYKKKCDIKEGVDRGTTHFLQNCIAENYSPCQDAGTATSDDFDKDIRERVDKVDCIRYFSGTSIAIYSSGVS